ncbi:TetR/AcrR family transcriptional regulator [Alkalibacillus aidingensis]|uniref:TetR/AcrR family transcriptional regulator n=1 Tax=Alkalibacillus aidingensis TaxID=2747607 RepID=UPI0016602B0B|nr:TetR/AcrR family transcriptional regulator [Alkalibacillus aidingensis]
MQEKKKRIIAASVDLFAEKGFHATSVQEIVGRANVAKGSFYNYFQSKNELVHSIYDYYYAVIQEQMDVAKQEGGSPKESLAKQLEVFYKVLLENKPLINMMINEKIPLGEDMEGLLINIRRQNHEWLRTNVKAIYGERVRPYLLDVIVVLEGMLQGYANWLINDEESVDLNRLPTFIVERLDDVTEQLIAKQVKPTITGTPKYLKEKSILLAKLRQKIQSTVSEEQTKAEEAITALEKELNKQEQEAIIIDSLLFKLEQFTELQGDVKTLREQLNI